MFPAMAGPKMTRDDRKTQIYNVLAQQGRAGITATMLFRLCGVKRTPYALALLNELWCEGWAVYEEQTLTNGLPVRVYFAAEFYFQNESASDAPQAPEDLPF